MGEGQRLLYVGTCMSKIMCARLGKDHITGVGNGQGEKARRQRDPGLGVEHKHVQDA